jgi:hypothetical protein
MSIQLGFDMGIRNLAYCMIKHSVDLSGNPSWCIMAWDNVDILEGGISSQISRSCTGCGHKNPCWSDLSGGKWCNACGSQKKVKKTATCKPLLPILPCSCNLKDLRTLAISMEVPNAKKSKKEILYEWASVKYLMPYKPVKTMKTSLENILKAMDNWLDTVLPTISQSNLIRLENQPVMKGPTMKSVQIILFTLLSHRLLKEYNWNGKIEFVHAGTKNKNTDLSGVSFTDEGAAYRARKKDATAETLKHLTNSSSSWLPFFESRTKKSDLADAFLMALLRSSF